MSCVSKASSVVKALRDPLALLAALAPLVLTMLGMGVFGPSGIVAPLLIGLVGMGATGRLLWRLAQTNRARARTAQLIDALESDSRARVIFDAEGQLLLRNRRAEELLGPADDPCAPFRALAPDDDRLQEDLTRLASAAFHYGAHRAELSLPGPDGGRDWLAVSVTPLPGGGILWSAEDISARRAIEETLRREHEMLADFIDFLPVGFYSADTEGRFRFVNHRLAEWIGLPVETLIGLHIGDVLGVEPNPEEDRAEMRMRGRNGEIFQAFVTHTVFDEGGETLTRSVVVRDLMPERHWERAVKQSERRIRWLFDDSPVGIVLVDPDISVSLCNPAFAAMAGRDGEDISGRPVSDFILTEDRPAAEEMFSRVLMGTSPGGHLPVRLTNSSRDMVATLHVGPTAEDGAVTGLMLHFIDTTEQKNLEIQFAQSQKMQAMGQLAGGVAHDFNNLLTAMIGFCDLLLQRHGPGDASFSDIMQVKQNANRAASLVRQLLAFSRRQTLQPRLFDVTDALADLFNLLRRLLGETTELVITHGRDLGMVRVDPGQFDQVIINLAVNARDAMPGGGILEITTRATQVERPIQRGADIMPPGSYVQIDVIDSGTGIPEELLGRIFEPFFSTKAVGAGTGLGLSTVYGIVRQTDGFIFVDSKPGQGTSFHIFLPRFDAVPTNVKPRASAELGTSSEPVASAEPASGDSTSGDLTGAGTILIVEDEDAVRLFGARALRNKGYRVIEARNGDSALEALRADP